MKKPSVRETRMKQVREPRRRSIHRDGDAIVVRVPARFRRRNGRQQVLADGPQAVREKPEEVPPLVIALAKAHRWQQQLESGQYASLEELAEANSVNRSYVGRFLRLTSLAPQIVEAALAGREPDGMSLEKLRRELSVVWAEQMVSRTRGASRNEHSVRRSMSTSSSSNARTIH